MLVHLPLIVVLLSSLDPAVVRARRVDALAHAVVDISPRSISLEEAYLHADAAVNAGEVLGFEESRSLGVACVETKFTERIRSNHGTGRYCGVMQATKDQYGYSCLELQNARIGYLVGTFHLRRWLRICHGDFRCALYRYGGVSKNGSTSYPDRVLRCIKAIREHVRRFNV